MRSLSESIAHYESITDDLDGIYDGYMAYGEQGKHVEECLKHANNARQLAKWLKELKSVYDMIDGCKDTDGLFVGYIRKRMKEA